MQVEGEKSYFDRSCYTSCAEIELQAEILGSEKRGCIPPSSAANAATPMQGVVGSCDRQQTWVFFGPAAAEGKAERACLLLRVDLQDLRRVVVTQVWLMPPAQCV